MLFEVPNSLPNAYSSVLSRLVPRKGRVKVVREVQLLKTVIPMPVTLSGITMLSRLVQSEKAELGIDVIFPTKWTALI